MTEQHFNDLSPAEAERLAMLAEEAAEVVQMVGKVLRHGYDSFHPMNPDGPRNRELLMKEIADFDAVKDLMYGAGDIDPATSSEMSFARNKKRKYAHHQRP